MNSSFMVPLWNTKCSHVIALFQIVTSLATKGTKLQKRFLNSPFVLFVANQSPAELACDVLPEMEMNSIWTTYW